MSTRDLPYQPSLRHLKQEVKQFHLDYRTATSPPLNRSARASRA